MKFSHAKTALVVTFMAGTLAATQQSYAGGALGNIVREVGRATGIKELVALGDAGDAAHRGLKQIIPLYGPLEEAASGAVHQLTSELGVEVAGPVLAGLIHQGISDAQGGTLHPLPAHVKRALGRYFPAALLDEVRWRAGYGAVSPQSLSLELGGADAITLDTIIVFKDGHDIENLHLVAHEIGHVLQYKAWGITDFAKRYVRNFGGVEAAAERVAQDWAAGKTLRQPVRRAGGGGGGGGGRSGISARLVQRR